MKLDYACGKHSGFPLCCVIFYLIRHECFEESTRILPRWIAKSEHISWYWNYSAKFGDRNYVACPVCLHTGRFAEIKKCGCFIKYLPDGDFIWNDDIEKKYKKAAI